MKTQYKILTRLMAIVVISLLLGMMFLPAAQASPPAQDPRPPFSPGGGGGGGGDGGDGDGVPGNEIVGTVIDINTGQPGAGLVVRINNELIRTDAAGTYSLTGVAVQPGIYEISLKLPPELTPAQLPQTIEFLGGRAVVDLQYYSGPVPAPTPSPLPPPPTPVPTPPPAGEFAPPTPTPDPSAPAISEEPPPDALPITGNKGWSGTIFDTLPATGFAAIFLLGTLGLSGLTFVVRHLRTPRQNEEEN